MVFLCLCSRTSHSSFIALHISLDGYIKCITNAKIYVCVCSSVTKQTDNVRKGRHLTKIIFYVMMLSDLQSSHQILSHEAFLMIFCGTDFRKTTYLFQICSMRPLLNTCTTVVLLQLFGIPQHCGVQ